PNAGFSTGDAINAIEEVAAEMLPASYTYEYSGLTREEINASGQTSLAMVEHLFREIGGSGPTQQLHLFGLPIGTDRDHQRIQGGLVDFLLGHLCRPIGKF